MSKTRLMQACAGVALAIGFANTASAELMVDLRLPAGVPGVVTGSKQVDVSGLAAGTVIPVDVYAVVTGPGTGPEGFQSMQGAFISNRTNNAGPTGQILPSGDVEEVNFTETIPAFSPFTGQGATRGTSKEIGTPDGVIDLGDEVVRGDDLGGLVVFRSPGMQVTSGAVIPNGREFRVGQIDFVVGSGGAAGETPINWAFRMLPTGASPRAEAALFRFDATNPANGTSGISVGAPVVFTVVPEPATFGLAAVGALGLLARRRRN